MLSNNIDIYKYMCYYLRNTIYKKQFLERCKIT